MSPRRRRSGTSRPSSTAGAGPWPGPGSAGQSGPVSNLPALGAALRADPGPVVLTGGQTGVDTLAALAALAVGLPVHMVFPRGMRQEDGPVTAERLARMRGAVLHELPDAEFAARTWSCVGLADAVILVDPAGGDGCAETVKAASRLGRPLLDLTAFAGGPSPPVTAAEAIAAEPTRAEATVARFLRQNSPCIVLFAGCRASRLAATGTTAAVTEVLGAVMPVVAGAAGGRPVRPPAVPPA